MSSLFPIFLKLEGRTALVVGAGKIAESKIEGLLESGAQVRVVAPAASDRVADLHRSGQVSWESRKFQPADLDGVFLVIAATASTEINDLVFREAQQRGILCNAVDDPERCDFFYPAVVRRGRFQIAISTAGLSPALAQRLRRELETQFGPEYGEWLEELGEIRETLMKREIDHEFRRWLLHTLASRESFEARFASAGSAA